MARTFTISSGKGGVGKTNLCVNLAIQLSALGHRTCVFDADLGLANINIVLGLYPEYTIEDVILGKLTLPDILIKDYHGIDIIPGSSGVEKIANIQPEQTEALIKSFEELDPYDFIFFDTSAGISRNVISFCLASSEIIMLITPEPTSLTDAYALIKVLTLNGLSSPVKVIVNQCDDTTVAKQTYTRFKEVVKKYLSIDVQALGFILKDPNISDAVKQQQPFISLYPSTIATKCVRVVANNLSGTSADSPEPAGAESFWKRFVGYFKGRLDLGHGIEEQPTSAAPPSPSPEAVEKPPAEEKPAVLTENNNDVSNEPPAENTPTDTGPEPAGEISPVTGDVQEPDLNLAAPESIPAVEVEPPGVIPPATDAAAPVETPAVCVPRESESIPAVEVEPPGVIPPTTDAAAPVETPAVSVPREPESIPDPQPSAGKIPVFEMDSEEPTAALPLDNNLEGDLEALSRNTAAEFESEPVAEMPPTDAAEHPTDRPCAAAESTSVSVREAREVASTVPLPDDPQTQAPPPVPEISVNPPVICDPPPVEASRGPQSKVNDTGSEQLSGLADVARPDVPGEGSAPSPDQAPSADSEPLEMPFRARSPENGKGSAVKDAPALTTAVVADQHIYSLMDRLVTSISSMTDEVKLLRTAVEGNGHIKADSGTSGTQPQPIPLDFNSFLTRRTKEK